MVALEILALPFLLYLPGGKRAETTIPAKMMRPLCATTKASSNEICRETI